VPSVFPIPGGLVDLGVGVVSGNAYISGARVTRRKPIRIPWPDQLTGDAVPTVATLTPASVTYQAATLRGTVNPQGHATTYRFEYGTTSSLGTIAGTGMLEAGTTTVDVSTTITVPADTTIYYRVFASNELGASPGSIVSFTSDPVPGGVPIVVTGSASGVGVMGATLNGTVDANGQATTAYFEYGTTTGYGTTTATQSVGSVAGVAASVSAPVGGIASGTTIHWRLVATNTLGTTQGSDATFTTTTPCGHALAAPGITLAAAPSSPPSDSVTVSADVTAEGQATTVKVQYGITTSYGTETTAIDAGASCSAATISIPLPPLANSTTFHYRFVAVNATGTTNSGDQSFTTLTAGGCSPAPPTVTGFAVTPTGTGTTAQVVATVGPNQVDTTLTINYGLTTAYGSTKAQAAGGGCSTGQVTVTLTGLTPNTTYHAKAVVTNGQGTAQTSDAAFTTLTVCGTAAAIPTLSLGAVSGLSSKGVTINPTVNAKGQTTTILIEYGTTTSYGSSSSSSAGASCTATLMPRNLAGLVSNTAYFYRVTVSNATGAATAATGTFTTYTICEAVAAAPTQSGTAVATLTTSTVSLSGALANPNGIAFLHNLEYKLAAGSTYAAVPGTYTFDPDVSEATCSPIPLAATIPASTFTANTAYNVRHVTQNSVGTTRSNAATFVAPGAPTVATVAASGITNSGATLNGTVQNNNVAGTVLWEWDLNSAPAGVFANSASVALAASASVQAVSKTITGLNGGKVYKFRVTFTRGDAAGAATTAKTTFTTSAASSLMWLHAALVPASSPARSHLFDENGNTFLGYGTGLNFTTDLTGPNSDLTKHTAPQADGLPLCNFIRAIVYWKQIQPSAPTVDGTGRLSGGWSTTALNHIRQNLKYAKDRGCRVMLDMHYNGDTANNNNTPNWLWSNAALSNGALTDSDFTNALFDNDWTANNGTDMTGAGLGSLGNMPLTAVDGEFGRPTCIAAAGGATLPRAWGPLTMWVEVIKKLVRYTVGDEALAHADGLGVLDNMIAIDCMNEPPPSNTARVNQYRAFIEAAGAQVKYINPKVVVCYEQHILQRNPIFANPSNPPVYGVYAGTITSDADVDQADVDTLPSRTTWPAGSGGWMMQMRGYVNGSPAAGNESCVARATWDKFALATKYDATMAWRAGHAAMIGEWTYFTANRSTRDKQWQVDDPRGGTPFVNGRPDAVTLLGGRGNSWATPGNTTGDYWDGRNNTTKAEGGFLDWMRANNFHQVVWPFANVFFHDDTVTSGQVANGGTSAATIAGCGGLLKTKSSGALNVTTNNNNVDMEGMLSFLRTGVAYT
jgi:hypothetical protein